MARNLRDAMDRHQRAADDLQAALRECLSALRESAQTGAAEARFEVIEGGQGAPAMMPPATARQRRGRQRRGRPMR